MFKRDFSSSIQSSFLYALLALFTLFGALFFIQYLMAFSHQLQSLSVEQQVNINFTNGVFIPFLGNLNFAYLIICPLIAGFVMNLDWKASTYYHWRLSKTPMSKIIINKYFTALILFVLFFGIGVLFIFSYPFLKIGLSLGVLMAYLALFLQGALYLALGIMAFSIFHNIPIALFLSFFLVLLNMSLNWMAQNIPNFYISEILNYLTFGSHLEIISQGMLRAIDVLFYLSSILICLFIAYKTLKIKSRING